MVLQRLYQLDRIFADELEKLLREDKYVDKLIGLQGDDLVQLVDYLSDLFYREAIVWKHLNHPNIVPFKGVTFDPLQLVSEWMPGGELRKYVENNPGANPISLLIGIAEGLAYLHSCEVIHGDLKGPNVVVDTSGNARITDFGLSSVVRDPSSVASASDGSGYTPRWTAPEILREGTPASKKSDVFSFAMVIFEVFSGTVPFHDVAAPAVPANIMGGKRPGQPTHPRLTDPLWKLTQRCWKDAAKDRPEMEEVIKELKGVSAKKVTPPLPPPLPAVIKGPSSMVSCKSSARETPKPSVDEGREAAPYDVDGSQPRPTPPPLKVEEKRQPAPKVGQIVGGGITNEPLLRPLLSAGNDDSLAKGSGVLVESERERREPQKKEERPEHKKSQKDLKREKKEREAQEAAEKAKDTPQEEPHKPSRSTTAADIEVKANPVRRPTTQESSPHHGNDNYKSAKVNQVIGGGITNEPPSGLPSSAGSTQRFSCEHF
ncbi:kinase-like protein [Thelephora ganbajun]|uniref:Kinase-like protein n=1 Tax=Thelephora ganbajun TaxID=370292 RepID=A0ACB6Z570_THEGA|nr:kinase-like protein [Thelephora ganbajun]